MLGHLRGDYNAGPYLGGGGGAAPRAKFTKQFLAHFLGKAKCFITTKSSCGAAQLLFSVFILSWLTLPSQWFLAYIEYWVHWNDCLWSLIMTKLDLRSSWTWIQYARYCSLPGPLVQSSRNYTYMYGFSLQNWPKMCILWDLSASEMAGKRLWEHSRFSKFSRPRPRLRTAVLAFNDLAPPPRQQNNHRYSPVMISGTVYNVGLLSKLFHLVLAKCSWETIVTTYKSVGRIQDLGRTDARALPGPYVGFFCWGGGRGRSPSR
jgi:hypothetical protein